MAFISRSCAHSIAASAAAHQQRLTASEQFIQPGIGAPVTALFQSASLQYASYKIWSNGIPASGIIFLRSPGAFRLIRFLRRAVIMYFRFYPRVPSDGALFRAKVLGRAVV